MPKKNKEEIRFKGIPVSPGIAYIGVIVRGHRFQEPDTYVIKDDEGVGKELDRFEDAIIKTRIQIRQLQKEIDKVGEGREAGIFDAHLLILEDQAVLDEVKRVLREKRKNIESIYYKVMTRYMDSLRQVDDPYLRERAVDVEDVTRRVVSNLTDKPAARTARHQHILISHDLTPSDTAEMNPKLVLGFATETGSYTSHTAIVARSMNIPAVVGLQQITHRLHTGKKVLLDGYNGLVIVNPTEETLVEYEKLRLAKDVVEQQLETLRETKSATLDGREITLSANIEFTHELPGVLSSGAEGIGLYRTEFFYLNRRKLPSEEEQFETYREVAEKVAPHGVIIRTLDVGGDKLPDVGNEMREIEPNPFLGWRGIRVSLELNEVFRTQIRAILRASAKGKVRIMFPMISGIEELREARREVQNCKQELRDEGIPFDESIEIGAMIEVPSAAVIAHQLAPEVDFFSIGTNDLIQYTIAVDRVNEHVSSLYQPTHPAIVLLISMVVEAAHANGIWVGVCGEMAGDIILTPLLIGLGVDEFSAGSSQIPRIKKAMLSLDFAWCQELAKKALTLSNAGDIKKLCRNAAMQHFPEMLV